MFHKKLNFLITIFVLCFSIQAQERKVIVCDKQSDEVVYKRWVERDVLYLITNKEKEDFLNLQTNDEKQTFIENFWLRRDPTPETEENEFREEYYERFAFANEKFSSRLLGWQMDRGFIYITYGKPDKIERQHGNFEGLENVLIEKWVYEYLPGEASKIEFTFFDPTESSEFRLENGKREKILKNIGNGLQICFNCYSK